VDWEAQSEQYLASEVGCYNLVLVRSEIATLDLLRPGDWVLSLSTLPTSVHIGSARGPAQYGCCFSTAAVSSDGIPETELVAVA
jgi:hypothetical protein